MRLTPTILQSSHRNPMTTSQRSMAQSKSRSVIKSHQGPKKSQRLAQLQLLLQKTRATHQSYYKLLNLLVKKLLSSSSLKICLNVTIIAHALKGNLTTHTPKTLFHQSKQLLAALDHQYSIPFQFLNT